MLLAQSKNGCLGFTIRMARFTSSMWFSALRRSLTPNSRLRTHRSKQGHVQRRRSGRLVVLSGSDPHFVHRHRCRGLIVERAVLNADSPILVNDVEPEGIAADRAVGKHAE